MTRIAIAMSGGVDSSVAAAILKKQGFDVIGLMMRLWSENGREENNRCCTPDSMALARRVAANLEIPFYTIDARQIFRKTVVEYFINEYSSGNTPNPCLICNQQVRWKFLLEHAQAMGAEFLATGHYARLQSDQQSDKLVLMRAVDKSKDQSYVLHALSQDQLRRTLFPLGDLFKDEVRKKAEEFGLPTAGRPDSQDLCFLGGGDYRDFLFRQAPNSLKLGDIVSSDGKKLGTHQGLAQYTIGQRKKLGISSPKPLYVVSKDIQSNTLVVGNLETLGREELVAQHVHWIKGTPPSQDTNVEVKIRYSARMEKAVLHVLDDGAVRVRFLRPQRDITPGQAAVFYNGEVVLGGGTIR